MSFTRERLLLGVVDTIFITIKFHHNREYESNENNSVTYTMSSTPRRAGKWALQSCGDRFVSGFLITGHAKFSLRNHACFDFRFALCSLWFGSSQSKWFFDVPLGKLARSVLVCRPFYTLARWVNVLVPYYTLADGS